MSRHRAGAEQSPICGTAADQGPGCATGSECKQPARGTKRSSTLPGCQEGKALNWASKGAGVAPLLKRPGAAAPGATLPPGSPPTRSTPSWGTFLFAQAVAEHGAVVEGSVLSHSHPYPTPRRWGGDRAPCCSAGHSLPASPGALHPGPRGPAVPGRVPCPIAHSMPHGSAKTHAELYVPISRTPPKTQAPLRHAGMPGSTISPAIQHGQGGMCPWSGILKIPGFGCRGHGHSQALSYLDPTCFRILCPRQPSPTDIDSPTDLPGTSMLHMPGTFAPHTPQAWSIQGSRNLKHALPETPLLL